MKINKNILPYVKEFIEKNIDLIENENFSEYIKELHTYSYNTGNLADEVVTSLLNVLKECYGSRYILDNIDAVPNYFFTEEPTNIIIPKNIINLESYAIYVDDARLIKFEESDKPIQLQDSSIAVYHTIDCIEFNRPTKISINTVYTDGFSIYIKKFNIFNDIKLVTHPATEPSETILDYVTEDGEINIKNGVTVKIGRFSSNNGDKIKKHLNTLGLKNVNLV